MSSSDSNGAIAGAATTGTGAAMVASDTGNNFLVTLGWIAMLIGLLILISFIVMFLLKRKLRNKE